MNEEQVKRLRAPFSGGAIGKLPRVTQRDGPKSRCKECGNYLPHHIHLDYVGHAAVTDRLLEVDPEWSWEPVAFDTDGAPLVRQVNANTVSLWIRLKVAGVERLGVGTAAAGKDDREKELISDALRNAAMRFGVALDLWSKEDLRSAGEDRGESAGERLTPQPDGSPAPSAIDDSYIDGLKARIGELGGDAKKRWAAYPFPALSRLPAERLDEALAFVSLLEGVERLPETNRDAFFAEYPKLTAENINEASERAVELMQEPF